MSAKLLHSLQTVEKPIRISSDSADLDDATGVAVYRGNVVMSQGTTQLKGDTVSVYVKDRKITRIVSKGGKQQAYYEEEQGGNQGVLKAWGNTIDYDLVVESGCSAGECAPAFKKTTFSLVTELSMTRRSNW